MTEKTRPPSKLLTRLCKGTTRRHFLTSTAKAGVGAAALPFILTPGKAKASAVIRYADDGGRTGQGHVKITHFPQEARGPNGPNISAPGPWAPEAC